MRVTRILPLALVLAVAPAAAAFAHAKIDSRSPKAGSTAPLATSAVTVRFTEAILGGRLTVRDADGDRISGKAQLIEGGRGLRASLRSGRSAGRHTVRVKWVSHDGHVQRKRWRFRLG